ncbi:MAG: RTC4-like domain-containing protein [Benjaminiella poitrasii]|nr:MAG: RTC4-like domain-containing protein [Benjaminiella poitrasii]
MYKKNNVHTFRMFSKKNGWDDPDVSKTKKESLIMPPKTSVSTSASTLVLPSNPHRVTRETMTQKRKHTEDNNNNNNDDDDFQKMSQLRKTINPYGRTHEKPRSTSFAKQAASTTTINDENAFRYDRQSLNTLRMPQKIKPRTTKTVNKTLLNNFKRAQQSRSDDDDKVQCPYCSEFLIPVTDAIAYALSDIRRKDIEHERHEETSVRGHIVTTARQPSSHEKDAFCRLHKLELIIKPQGIKRQYPFKIDFDALPKRIAKFDSELRQIIQNKLPSHYRQIAEEAYSKLGKNKARSTMGVMNRFETCLPGYYGPRGAAMMLETLSRMYMEDSNVLEDELVSQQLPMEFLQQVLVPEIGVRLIREDICRKQGVMPEMMEKAQQLMEESREFGNVMFPVIENQDNITTTLKEKA